MNKRIFKKILISIGLILLVLNFIICLNESRDIFVALFNMGYETLNDFGELESILTILGIVFFTFGLIIKKDNISTEAKNYKNSIKKYKILRILGYLPFIGIFSIASHYAIYGLSLFSSKSHGFNAFCESFMIFSLGLWHLYIIGIILIIKSSLEIRNLKKSENQVK